MHNERGPTQEVREKREFGTNVTLVIDLIRHPEKDYSTGDLTDTGKRAFLDKLREEYSNPENTFDTIKCYVSPLKRGQQAMEPLTQFIKENNIASNIGTKQQLLARMDEYSGETDQALDILIKERTTKDVSTAQSKEDALEPTSKDEETLKNEILIREFFDKEFPKIRLKGEDVGKELDALIQHFARMAQRLYSGSKVKMIVVGHSGIIEYLTKFIYLKNHPEVNPTDVGVEDIGGLLDYMSGPQIRISSDESGNQVAQFSFKKLSLNYPLVPRKKLP